MTITTDTNNYALKLRRAEFKIWLLLVAVRLAGRGVLSGGDFPVNHVHTHGQFARQLALVCSKRRMLYCREDSCGISCIRPNFFRAFPALRSPAVWLGEGEFWKGALEVPQALTTDGLVYILLMQY